MRLVKHANQWSATLNAVASKTEYFSVGLQRCTVDCGTLCNKYCELRQPAPKKQNRDQLWRLWGQGAGLSPLISECVCVCCCCQLIDVAIVIVVAVDCMLPPPACLPATRSLAGDAMARKTGADCHTLKFNLCVLGVCVCV